MPKVNVRLTDEEVEALQAVVKYVKSIKSDNDTPHACPSVQAAQERFEASLTRASEKLILASPFDRPFTIHGQNTRDKINMVAANMREILTNHEIFKPEVVRYTKRDWEQLKYIFISADPEADDFEKPEV